MRLLLPDKRLAKGGEITGGDVWDATVAGFVLRLRPKLMTVTVGPRRGRHPLSGRGGLPTRLSLTLQSTATFSLPEARRPAKRPSEGSVFSKEGCVAMPNQEIAERCLTECLECVRRAGRCASQCIQSEESARMAECVRLCLDCVDTASACVSLLARESRFARALCSPCAEICADCAAECERQGQEDDVMRQCADACRRCAATCREMAA